MKKIIKDLYTWFTSNFWWILLWYLINVFYFMHNNNKLDATVAIWGVITAIGVIVFANKDTEPRKGRFS